jgi:hypothetical protein
METIQLAEANSKAEAYELVFGTPADDQGGLLGRLKVWKAKGYAGENWTLEVLPTAVHDGTVGGYFKVVLHMKEDEKAEASA